MITATQALPTILTTITPVTSQPVLNSAQLLESLLAVPGVIVSLGMTPAHALTYNAAGLYESLLPAAESNPEASLATASPVATTSATTKAVAIYQPSPEDLSVLMGWLTSAASSGLGKFVAGLQSLPAAISQTLKTLLVSNSNLPTVSDSLSVSQNLAQTTDQRAVFLDHRTGYGDGVCGYRRREIVVG